MWRHISRPFLKENLSRAFNQYNGATKGVIVKNKTQGALESLQIRSVPLLVEHIYRHYHKSTKCVCGCHSGGSQERKQKESNKNKTDSPLNDIEYQFLEALGWSSVFIIGWYICHPLRRQSNYWKNRAERDKAVQILKKQNDSYLFNVTSNTVSNTSKLLNYILPQASATKKSDDIKRKPVKSRDEVLQTSLANLEEAHEIVLSKLDNWLGTECMQSGQHKDGADYFVKAVKSDNANAMFNLGICYETGLGKKQNFKKAAKLYQQASDLGHPTAMYNLGVFHVHGWGGLESNTDRARQLFEKAAKLGQKEAMNALSIPVEDTGGDVNDNKEQSSTVLFSEENYNFKIEPNSTDDTNVLFNVLGVSLVNFNTNSDVFDDKKKSVDSGVLDLSPDIDIGIDFHSNIKNLVH